MSRRQYSRSLIHDMHRAEAKIRKSLSGKVRQLSQEEIAELAGDLVPPCQQRDDYRGAYVD